MFSRIKKIIKLSKKADVVERISDKDIDLLPNNDEKAEFFGEPTKEDYEEYLREESGLNKWYKRLRDL